MFGIVTFIQVLGNIFYSYANIEETDVLFQKWIELTSPIFESMGTDPGDIIPHKRWLALLEGGLLPLISLTSLHFYTKYEKDDDQANDQANDQVPTKPKDPEPEVIEPTPDVTEEPQPEPPVEEEVPEEPTIEDLGEYNKLMEEQWKEKKKPVLGKYDQKFGPEYTKMMDEIREEINEEEKGQEFKEELIPQTKKEVKPVYNNLLDVDSKEELDTEDEVEGSPIPEEARQKHLKFRKRLIAKEEEKKKEEEEEEINTDNNGSQRRIDIIDDGRKAVIYPKTKRDKITQKKIK
jgi:hypothetical protein